MSALGEDPGCPGLEAQAESLLSQTDVLGGLPVELPLVKKMLFIHVQQRTQIARKQLRGRWGLQQGRGPVPARWKGVCAAWSEAAAVLYTGGHKGQPR